MKPAIAAAAAFFPILIGSARGEPEVIPSDGMNFLSALNAAKAGFGGSFGMDFDNSPGVGIDATFFEIGSFISKPIDLFAGYQLLPYAGYEAHFLRVDGALPGFPLEDEDLHEIGLSLFIYKFTTDSPWVSGLWFDSSVASDFQHVTGDDVFLDVAAAAGYRFSDNFLLGIGVGALNLTGDTSVYPGIGFAWNPSDETFVTLYGPHFRAGWEVCDTWRLGFEVRPNGGIWNIDTTAGSRNIDYTSFRAGLTSSHQITEKLWLAVGGGVTLANSLNITNTDGSDLFKNTLDDLDEGFYGFVSLNLKAW